MTLVPPLKPGEVATFCTFLHTQADDPLEAVRLMRAQTASCFEKVWRDRERRRGVRTNTRPQ